MRNTKKVVVIHIDALRREYLSAWLLGKKFKSAGFKVLLTSRHTTQRLLKYFTPDIFVSTHVFLLRPSEWADLNKRGTKVYINEVEGTDHEFGVTTTYPDEFCNEKIDYSIFSAIFVWGKFSYEWILKNRNVKKEKLFLNGSTRQSKLSRPIRKKGEIVVGILSRFEVINTFDRRHPFINLIALDPEDKSWRWYFERCVIDSETFSIVAKLIKKLIENGYKISMRAHPNENIAAYDLLNNSFGDAFIIDNSYSINEWLSSVSVVVGTTSTAFTEPFLARIPIISTSCIQQFHYQHEDQANLIKRFDKAAYTPASVEDVYKLCINPNLEPKYSIELDHYFNEFYTLDNEIDPIEKIVEVVVKDQQSINKLQKNNYSCYYAQFLFLLLCDLIFICKSILRNPSIKTFEMLKEYNYNRFFHQPSIFMKNILK